MRELRDHIYGKDSGLVIHTNNDNGDIIVLTDPTTTGILRGANHHNCGGAMDLSNVGTYSVFSCRICYLRVIFPPNLETIRQLKRFFEKKERYKKPSRFDLLDLRMEELNLIQKRDDGELEVTVDEVLSANPQAVEDVTDGGKKSKKARGFLIGQVMQKTKEQANPKVVSEILAGKLG